MWSPIISLVKTNRYYFEFHSSPTWNEYHLWSSALSYCGWLASSFDQCLHESINVRIPLEISWLALFWVLLAFLDQSFWLLQLSISNISWITTFMLAFQVSHLVYLQKVASPYTRENWPFSKELLLILNWNDLIDWSKWWT